MLLTKSKVCSVHLEYSIIGMYVSVGVIPYPLIMRATFRTQGMLVLVLLVLW